MNKQEKEPFTFNSKAKGFQFMMAAPCVFALTSSTWAQQIAGNPRPVNAAEEADLARAMQDGTFQRAASGNAAVKCDGSATADGDFNEDRRIWTMDSKRGFLTLRYDAYGIPDTFKIVYDNKTIWSSGGLVSGADTVVVAYGPGKGKQVEVIVNEGGNSNDGTAWAYQLRCAGELQLYDTRFLSPSDEIPNGGIAWITGTNPPQMPTFRAELPLAPTPGTAKKIKWSLKGELVRYKSGGKGSPRDTFEIAPPDPVPTGTPWLFGNVSGKYKDSHGGSTSKQKMKIDGNFIGGDYELSASTDDTRTLSFFILGENPTNSDVLSEIRKHNKFSWLPYMAQKETYGYGPPKAVFNQFLGLKGRVGVPIWGSPDGWGIMQMDSSSGRRITNEERWNWLANVEAGCAVMKAKKKLAESVFNKVKNGFSNTPGHKWTTPPSHVQVALKYKDGSKSETLVPLMDAIAIIYYNGATFEPRSAGKQEYPTSGGSRIGFTPLIYDETVKDKDKRFTFRDNEKKYLANTIRFYVKNPDHNDDVYVPDVVKSAFQLVNP